MLLIGKHIFRLLQTLTVMSIEKIIATTVQQHSVKLRH